MAKIKFVLLLPLLMLLLCSCSEVNRYTEYSFYAMNTFITVIGENVDAEKTEATTIEHENKLSRTISDSEISRLNSEGKAELSDSTALLVEKAIDVANKTDGAFNPCMGSIVSLWDITSGKNYVPSQEEISLALEHTDFNSLVLDKNTVSLKDKDIRVDLGGIAKGYVLGLCMDFLKNDGAQNVCISFGGNVGVCGSSASRRDKGLCGWVVGITNPFNKEDTLGNIVLHDGYIAVSGAYERFFEKNGKVYHHIFDSKTGMPSESDVASSCVITKDAALGDALSTALFVMGSADAVDFYNSGVYDFEMILIKTDGEILISGQLKDVFTLTDDDFTVKCI